MYIIDIINLTNNSLDLSLLDSRNNLYHYMKNEQLHIENLNNGISIALTNKPISINEDNNISTILVFPEAIKTKIFSKPLINKDRKVNNLFLEYFLCIKYLFRNNI